MLNIKNLNRLINHLKALKNNKNFNMSQWVRFDDFENQSDIDWYDEPAEKLVARMQEKGDCGTTACLAGHAVILKSAAEGDYSGKYGKYEAKEQARSWLGLTAKQADLLFEPRTESDYLISFSREQAIETLERLRNTGKVYWPVEVKHAGNGNWVEEDHHG